MSDHTASPTPAAPPDVPLVPPLTKEDLQEEANLYDILTQETIHLGKHGATLTRRQAAGRVQSKLILLKNQILPIISGC